MSTDANLEADLPEHARERIDELKQRKLFTSDLSVSEFVLVREAGFDPLGLVMGTSIYQVAPNLPNDTGPTGCELEATTKALYHARELAMSRMEEEAEAIGADGIVGVRLTVNVALDPKRARWEQYRTWTKWAKKTGFRRPQQVQAAGWFDSWAHVAKAQWSQWCHRMGWTQEPLPPWSKVQGQAAYSYGPNTTEFIAIGTAVKHRGGEPYRNKKGKPFQSDLSGQDFWLLIRTGYRPVGFVMGNCVYYVPPKLLQIDINQSRELHGYTHGLYEARELAIERLQDEAEELGATGIVGVTVTEKEHSGRTNPWDIGNAALRSGEVIELLVIGTAVVPTGEAAKVDRPTLVLTANDIEPMPKEEE